MAAMMRAQLFDVLLRACPSTSSHTRPQLREHDDAFVAVERYDGGNGWCRIRRGGLEKVMWSRNFPPTVGDVDVKGLDDREFTCPLWREGDCGAGAGDGELEGGQLRARVCKLLTLLLLQLKCTALWNLQPPCKPW